MFGPAGCVLGTLELVVPKPRYMVGIDRRFHGRQKWPLKPSGGHTRMGQVCGNVNRNLKWAFVETGNLIVINQRGLAGTHVLRLYQRIKRGKNHQKAVVAVARHLAEAAWWVLTKQEVYREPHGPRQQALSSTHG